MKKVEIIYYDSRTSWMTSIDAEKCIIKEYGYTVVKKEVITDKNHEEILFYVVKSNT